MKNSQFQFSDPYLVELQFLTNPEFDTQNSNVDVQNLFQIHIKKSETHNRANVELKLESNMENENAPYTILARVAADFIWEELDDETVETMLNLNAPALLLGYMRPIVANVTNSSAFPAYNLPFMNFKD